MNTQDVLDRLRGIIDGGEAFEVDREYPYSVAASHVKLNCDDVAIVIFVDAGELDYVDWVELGDGTMIEFIGDEDLIEQLSDEQYRKLLSLCEAHSAILLERRAVRASQGLRAALRHIKRWASTGRRSPVVLPPLDRPVVQLSNYCPSEQLALLPWGRSLHVCRVEEAVIESLAEMPTDRNDAWTIAMPFIGEVSGLPGTHMAIPFVSRPGTTGWLAGVTSDFTSATVIEIDESSKQLRQRLLLMAPDGCHLHSCAMDGSTLYLGGTPEEASSTPSLWDVKLEKETRWLGLRVWFARCWRFLRPHSPLDPSRRWLKGRHRVKLDPPTKYFPTEQKSFDDLIIDRQRNRMIAIDDIVFPKYLFEFSLDDNRPPQQKRTVAIDGHATDERIVKGALGSEYLVLLSCFAGWNNSDRRCVSFLDSESLLEVASIHLPSEACQDIAIEHGCVFIAGGKHGLGTIHVECHGELEGGQPHPLILGMEHPSSQTPLAVELAARLRYYAVDHVGSLKSAEPQDEKGLLMAIFEESGQFLPAALRYDQAATKVHVEKSYT